MKLTRKELLSSFILIIVLIAVIVLVIPFGNIRRNDFLVLTTFALNGFIWTILLIKEMQKRAFSLAFMHWSFCLLFFFFAAIVQYTNGIFPWIYHRDDEVLFFSNVILFIWTICVLVGSHARFLKLDLLRKYLSRDIYVENISGLSLIILAGIAAWRVASIDIIHLLSRKTSGYIISDNSSLALVLDHSIEAIAYFSTLFFIYSCKNKVGKKHFVFVSVLLLLIAYPPSGVARYEAAAIYLGIFLSCSSYIKKSKVFCFLFLGGFFLVLPFLNAFRNTAFDNVSLSQVVGNIINNLPYLWLAGDYDAYTMLTLATDYIENYGVTWGYQFLGAVFFWIPRHLWIDKPIGSGAEIANSLGWNFTNLSCPLPSEALINFSIIGVIVFGFFLGVIIKFFDDLYWTDPFGFRMVNFIYPVVVVLFFFMCRGDLLSATAYMAAFLIIGIIYIKTIGFINKITP